MTDTNPNDDVPALSPHTSGPGYFQQAALEFEASFEPEAEFALDPGSAEAEEAAQNFRQSASINIEMAKVAAIVMLTEVIAKATNTDHPELARWRRVLPLDDPDKES